MRCQVAVISKSRRASTQTFHWSWRRLYACPMFLWSCLAGGGWEGGPRVPASCSDSLAEQQTGSRGSCLLLACLHNPQLLEDKAISFLPLLLSLLPFEYPFVTCGRLRLEIETGRDQFFSTSREYLVAVQQLFRQIVQR